VISGAQQVAGSLLPRCTARREIRPSRRSLGPGRYQTSHFITDVGGHDRVRKSSSYASESGPVRGKNSRLQGACTGRWRKRMCFLAPSGMNFWTTRWQSVEEKHAE